MEMGRETEKIRKMEMVRDRQAVRKVERGAGDRDNWEQIEIKRKMIV
jgi:hypothetical protein